MKHVILMLLIIITLICCKEESFDSPNNKVEFFISKHNVIQTDSVYNHEVYITINNFTGEFSIDGVLINTINKISIITNNQYSIIKLNKNYKVTITGFCNNKNIIVLKYTSKISNSDNVNNFILSYGFNEDYTIKMISLNKNKNK